MNSGAEELKGLKITRVSLDFFQYYWRLLTFILLIKGIEMSTFFRTIDLTFSIDGKIEEFIVPKFQKKNHLEKRPELISLHKSITSTIFKKFLLVVSHAEGWEKMALISSSSSLSMRLIYLFDLFDLTDLVLETWFEMLSNLTLIEDWFGLFEEFLSTESIVKEMFQKYYSVVAARFIKAAELFLIKMKHKQTDLFLRIFSSPDHSNRPSSHNKELWEFFIDRLDFQRVQGAKSLCPLAEVISGFEGCNIEEKISCFVEAIDHPEQLFPAEYMVIKWNFLCRCLFLNEQCLSQASTINGVPFQLFAFFDNQNSNIEIGIKFLKTAKSLENPRYFVAYVRDTKAKNSLKVFPYRFTLDQKSRATTLKVISGIRPHHAQESELRFRIFLKELKSLSVLQDCLNEKCQKQMAPFARTPSIKKELKGGNHQEASLFNFPQPNGGRTAQSSLTNISPGRSKKAKEEPLSKQMVCFLENEFLECLADLNVHLSHKSIEQISFMTKNTIFQKMMALKKAKELGEYSETSFSFVDNFKGRNPKRCMLK